MRLIESPADRPPGRVLIRGVALAGVSLAALLGPVTAAGAAAAERSNETAEAAEARAGAESLAARLDDHELAVIKLVRDRDIAIPYSYIAMLMHVPNTFGEGAACVLCHGSADPAHSYRGLDLRTCAGIKRGATEEPARALFEPGHGAESRLARSLRNNRMPPGVPFDAPTETPAITTVKAWIDDGAPDDAAFAEAVLPLMRDAAAFGGTQACVDCHPGGGEAPGDRELDLRSYDGIMQGAVPVGDGSADSGPRPIVVAGDAAASPLYRRLVENRMPAGISHTENRDHPNIQILIQWIDQGASCE